MPAKSRFTRLDAFTKTVDEARVRTTSGGIVTIASLLIVLYLAWGEWADYRRIVVHPELIVDKGRGGSRLIHERNIKPVLMMKDRRKDGDPSQYFFSSNSLRTTHTGCNGRFWRTANWSHAWRE